MNYLNLLFFIKLHPIFFLGHLEKKLEVTSYNIRLRQSMLKLSWIVMDHVKEGIETNDCITIFFVFLQMGGWKH